MKMHYLYHTQHISRCRNLKETLFEVYTFHYESDLMLRQVKKWRFIMTVCKKLT